MDGGEEPGGAVRAASTEAELTLHAPVVRRYLAGMLRPDELEDATQTVLQRALELLGRFRGESSLRVWLLGIARNVGLEVGRARQRRVARTRSTVALGEDGLDALGPDDLFAPAAPDQEERLGRMQQQALMLAALDELGLDDKLALLVTYVDGLPGPEAAELLGVSFAAFRQRLSRARQALARRLEVLAASGAPASADVLAQWQALLDPGGARPRAPGGPASRGR
jgi:RNA polymerase sigma-70 factor (ECF subfamily)